jgi:thymidine kinase
MYPTPQGTGWIEVIAGSMFSGKTEELIRRLRLASYARRQVAIFKPRIDDRYSETEIVSHNRSSLPSFVIVEAKEILLHAGEAEVVGIDEVHFLTTDVIDICEDLADAGKRVIVAGLDQDYRGRPFEPMPHLMAIAEYVTKVHAICVRCGNPANRSQRLVDRSARIVVGAAESYEARCRRCFERERFRPVQEALPLAKEGGRRRAESGPEER